MKEQEVVAILPIDAQIEVIKYSGRTLEQIYEIKRQRANPDQLSSGTPDLQPSQY